MKFYYQLYVRRRTTFTDLVCMVAPGSPTVKGQGNSMTYYYNMPMKKILLDGDCESTIIADSIPEVKNTKYIKKSPYGDLLM
jgi:hypothetical protein